MLGHAGQNRGAIAPVDGTFDVVGARTALAFFSAVERERLAHGYLFTGSAGIGKKTFARRLAQSLLCETPKSTLLGYCERCTACTLFVAGTHPDFVAAEGTLKIGNAGGGVHDVDPSARDLVRELSLRGYRSAYRVVLLGDVAFATHEAANALLKFFEEPPAGVVVVLTTNAPGALLATIRSRLIELAFSPLATADVEAVLARDGVAAQKARLAAASLARQHHASKIVLDDDESGFRQAAFMWFDRAVQGMHPDAGFLQLDDRSLSGAKNAPPCSSSSSSRASPFATGPRSRSGAEPAFSPPIKASSYHRCRRACLEECRCVARRRSGKRERLARTNVSAGLIVDYLRMQLAP